MAESIDDITYDYEDEGRLVRKELERHVLSKGAWATVMFLFQELDRKTEDWRAPKVAIVRYKKWNGAYRKQSGFNISSAKQARQIISALDGWFPADAVAEAKPAAKKKAAKAAPKKKAAKKKVAKKKAAAAPDEDQPDAGADD